MIKFIHTGDIHLGLQFNSASFSKEKASIRRSELWGTFHRIITYARESNVDFILISGDLYEDDLFTLSDISRVRDILKEAIDVNVIIIAGNHDILNKKSLYNKIEWSPNVTIFESKLDSKEFPHLDTIVYGYSWDRSEIKENTIFKEFKDDSSLKNKILLLHGDINKESSYLPINLDDLKNLKLSYIALGHIHKPEFIYDNIAYCGCPEPLDFGETGLRGFIEGTIDKGDTKCRFVAFNKRTFHVVKLGLDNSFGYQDILNRIRNIDLGNHKKDFYRVTLIGYLQRDIHLSNLEEDLMEDFYHIEIVDDTTLDYDLEALENENQDNIIGQFVKTMRQKNFENPLVRDALYIGLNVLLKGRD